MPRWLHSLRDRLRRRQRQQRLESSLCDALVDQSRVAIMIFDEDNLLVRANEPARALTGWPLDEMLGKHYRNFIALPAELIEPGADYNRVLCSRLGTGAIEATRLDLLTRDGKVIPVMTSSAALRVHGQYRGWACFFWDIRRQIELEREALRRRQQAEELAAMAREIGMISEQDQRLSELLERACRVLDLDLAAWGMLDENREELIWTAAHGLGADQLLGPLRIVRNSPLIQTLMAGQTYIYSSGGILDPHLSPLPLHAFTVIPYRLRARSQGVLLGACRRAGALAGEDLLLFSHLGAYLSTAAENVQLLKDMRHLAVLEERQRLAGEIHDHIGQVLTFLGMRLHVVDKALAQNDLATAAEEVAGLRQVVASAHQEIRASLYDLRKSAQPRSPLLDRWKKLLDDFANRTGIATRIETPWRPTLVLPQPIEAQLTRILQEALANTRHHSGASTVTVQAHVDRATLFITIEDDGCGFDTTAPADPHRFGLTLMRERAAAIGARLTIQSARGQGTRISLELPLPSREEAEHEYEAVTHPAG
ncbi:GAF domain-containing protein [Symbiobacterium terraclitae]|uniref:GAF domain-containing protein n=1 Tax=Symbiobacterium terraclitae TaxID=557451 RepID=UPI0035B506E2